MCIKPTSRSVRPSSRHDGLGTPHAAIADHGNLGPRPSTAVGNVIADDAVGYPRAAWHTVMDLAGAAEGLAEILWCVISLKSPADPPSYITS